MTTDPPVETPMGPFSMLPNDLLRLLVTDFIGSKDVHRDVWYKVNVDVCNQLHKHRRLSLIAPA